MTPRRPTSHARTQRLKTVGVICAFHTMLAPIAFGQQQAAPEKPHLTRMLFAQVWPSGHSEVWLDGPGSSAHFVTNINVNIFEPALLLETPTVNCDFIIITTAFTAEDVRQGQADGSVDARGFPHWPQNIPAAAAPARYVRLASSAGATVSSGDWPLSDLLHQYYRVNREQLLASYRQRQIDHAAASAAEAARRAAIPPYFGPPAFFKRFEQACDSTPKPQ